MGRYSSIRIPNGRNAQIMRTRRKRPFRRGGDDNTGPIITSFPTLAPGTFKVGIEETMTGGEATAIGGGAITYEFRYRADGDVRSATETHTYIAADYGKFGRAEWRAVETGGSSPGETGWRVIGQSPITDTVPENTAIPVVTYSGTNASGALVTTDGTWSGLNLEDPVYDWERNDSIVAGQTSSTYTGPTGDGDAVNSGVSRTNIDGTARAESLPYVFAAPVVTIAITGSYMEGDTVADVTTNVTGATSGTPALDHGDVSIEVDGQPQAGTYVLSAGEELVARFTAANHPTGGLNVASAPVTVEAFTANSILVENVNAGGGDRYGFGQGFGGAVDPTVFSGDRDYTISNFASKLSGSPDEIVICFEGSPTYENGVQVRNSSGTLIDTLNVTLDTFTGTVTWVSGDGRYEGDGAAGWTGIYAALQAAEGTILPQTITEPAAAINPTITLGAQVPGNGNFDALQIDTFSKNGSADQVNLSVATTSTGVQVDPDDLIAGSGTGIVHAETVVDYDGTTPLDLVSFLDTDDTTPTHFQVIAYEVNNGGRSEVQVTPVVDIDFATPSISSAATNVDGDEVTFTHARDVVNSAGYSVAGKTTSGVSGSGTTRTLAGISPVIASGETVTGDYTPGDVVSTRGIILPATANISVLNNVPGGVPMDDFVGTSGTLLSAHTAPAPASWSYQQVQGTTEARLTGEAVGAVRGMTTADYYYIVPGTDFADGQVTATVEYRTSGTPGNVDIGIRHQFNDAASGRNQYLLRWHEANKEWQLRKRVGNGGDYIDGEDNLADAAFASNGTQRSITLSVSGNILTATIDGVGSIVRDITTWPSGDEYLTGRPSLGGKAEDSHRFIEWGFVPA